MKGKGAHLGGRRKETWRIQFAMCKGQSKTHISLKSPHFNLNPFSFCSSSAIDYGSLTEPEMMGPKWDIFSSSWSWYNMQSGYLPTGTFISLPDRWGQAAFNQQLNLAVFLLSPLTNLLLQTVKPSLESVFKAFVKAISITFASTSWFNEGILSC